MKQRLPAWRKLVGPGLSGPAGASHFESTTLADGVTQRLRHQNTLHFWILSQSYQVHPGSRTEFPAAFPETANEGGVVLLVVGPYALPEKPPGQSDAVEPLKHGMCGMSISTSSLEYKGTCRRRCFRMAAEAKSIRTRQATYAGCSSVGVIDCRPPRSGLGRWTGTYSTLPLELVTSRPAES